MQDAALRRGRLRIRVVASTAAMLWAVSPVYAQRPAILSGVVTDAADNPVFGARLSIAGTSLVATSDDAGHFRIPGIAPGPVEIQARRLGFSPATQRISAGQQESLNRVHIRLAGLPGTISPVVIQVNRVKYSGRLAGYYERLRRRSGGHFISRAEIDSKNHRSLSQLLAQTPGVNAVRGRGGLGAVRMRGRTCRPLVWIDGTPMPAGEVDLDAFSPITLHGIEMYLGGTNAPIEYTASMGQSNCGTILLWSRGKDTEFAGHRDRPSVDLETMLGALMIFTADQVDQPAALAGAQPPGVRYPLSLFASGVSGDVMAEFVVDTAGRIEAGTLAFVCSAHPLFSEAVSEGLEHARYSPALKGGIAVRQIVHQPFAFAAAVGASRKKCGGTEGGRGLRNRKPGT